jgi:hypothetical protein
MVILLSLHSRRIAVNRDIVSARGWAHDGPPPRCHWTGATPAVEPSAALRGAMIETEAVSSVTGR